MSTMKIIYLTCPYLILLIYLHIHFQGAIVYLSLQVSRCHQKVSERKEKPEYGRNCLISQISQVVFCHPTTVRRLGEQRGEIQDSGKGPIEWVGHILLCVLNLQACRSSLKTRNHLFLHYNVNASML